MNNARSVWELVSLKMQKIISLLIILVINLCAEAQSSYVDYYNTGIIKLKSGQIKEAEPFLKQSYKLNPNYYNAVLALGILYEMEIQMYSEKTDKLACFILCINYLDKAIILHPNDPKPQALKGNAYLKMSFIKDACICWLKAKTLGDQAEILASLISEHCK